MARSRRDFNYQPPSFAETVERAERKGSLYASMFKDVKVWTPKQGMNLVRILPPTWEKNGGNYGVYIKMHYNVGPKEDRYLCLNDKYSPHKRCPIDEALYDLGPNATRDEKFALRAADAVVYYIIDRDNERDGVQVWLTNPSNDSEIAAQSVDTRNKSVLPIADIDDGYDIEFRRQGSGRKGTKYMGFKVVRDSSPLCDNERRLDEWLDFIFEHPLPTRLNFYTPENIEGVFYGRRDESVESRRSRSSRRDDDDDDAVQEEPRRPLRRMRADDDDVDRRDDREDGRVRHERDDSDNGTGRSGRYARRDDPDEVQTARDRERDDDSGRGVDEERLPRSNRVRDEDTSQDDEGRKRDEERPSRSTRSNGHHRDADQDTERPTRSSSRDEDSERPARSRARDDDPTEREERPARSSRARDDGDDRPARPPRTALGREIDDEIPFDKAGKKADNGHDDEPRDTERAERDDSDPRSRTRGNAETRSSARPTRREIDSDDEPDTSADKTTRPSRSRSRDDDAAHESRREAMRQRLDRG
jgi:hypothetical protein